uniref:Peptidase S54 rhomboid domain-containing protein n=1 Tax=Vitis vinifera TaxID=29760 RepID=A5BYB6_VITVI|nr:hypothetical protein VITISV_008789 [Vitis vinifera]
MSRIRSLFLPSVAPTATAYECGGRSDGGRSRPTTFSLPSLQSWPHTRPPHHHGRLSPPWPLHPSSIHSSRVFPSFLLSRVFIGQAATQGKLLLWGAKVNCFSLNSVGPTVENLSGPRRYLAVYFTSAIASSAMSYWLCKGPAVGASGAIFGLVGSVAVFMMRHRGLVGDSKESLQHIARVIVLNMVIGCLSKGIDNWGHLGGLLGGLVTSWLLGPAWKYESLSNDGRRVFADRAPIFHLVNRRRKP